MKSMLRIFVYLWASPTTLVGLVAALLTLATRGRLRVHTGVVEIDGGFASWLLQRLVPLPGGASAMTLGHVVLAIDADTHDLCRSHERVHVRQCERWGPIFIPAYLLASVWCWCSGRDAYRANPFEVEAYREG
jgi:hypothetical protein